jgi:succinate-semialdehyde dehydrogenase/glutarate-semialdehyde dehydrogenase
MLQSTNPAKENELLGEVETTSIDDLPDIVNAAHRAQNMWRAIGLNARIEHVRTLHDHLFSYKKELAQKQSIEMGMPMALSLDIVDSGLADMIWNCDNAQECLKTEILYEDDTEITEQIHEPYGVVACIAAWNFPFGNFVASLCQAILTGNTAIMKYSEEVPLFSKYFEGLIDASNFPQNIVQFIYGDGKIGSALADQNIDFLTFTGSTATGQKLYEKAASKMIPIALELGGSSPGIVFEDCIIDDDLIDNLFWKRFLNSAQFCDGLKRLFIHESLFDEIVKKLSAYTQTKKIGDPSDPQTDLGPLVAERQVLKLEEQIEDARQKGAKIHCGGQRPADLQGAFYEPTILTNITKDMRVWGEEVFGPALPIMTFSSYEEAIFLANETDYGLSASIFTTDQNLARKAMIDLKAGSIDHNRATYFRSQNPFGGYKKSGIGRQQGKAGFHDVTQIKVIAIQK